MPLIYSSDVLLFLSEILGFILIVVGIFTIFCHSLVALYHLFGSAKRWDEVRRHFSKRLLVGLEFIIAADIIIATSAQTAEMLITLAVFTVIRFLLGYTLSRELK